MGLFRGRAESEAAPIEIVRRGKVAAAHVLEGVLTLKIVTAGGEALIEVPGKALLTAGGRMLDESAAGFAEAVASIVGAKVKEATFERGKSIKLDFGKAGTLAISLAEGDYKGSHALLLKGPGRSYSSYHCEGITRLGM